MKTKQKTIAIITLLMVVVPIIFVPFLAFAENDTSLTAGKLTTQAENPYTGGNANCTYVAWEKANELAGVSLPKWGNAMDWYANAANSGYSVGSTPRAKSIAVWGPNKYSSLGHVAYVSDVSSSGIYVMEGGYHEGWNNNYQDLNFTGFIYPDSGSTLSPVLSDNKNVVLVGENMTFTYSGLTEASNVEICFCRRDGSVYFRDDATKSRNYTTYFVNEGTYYVFVRGLPRRKLV